MFLIEFPFYALIRDYHVNDVVVIMLAEKKAMYLLRLVPHDQRRVSIRHATNDY